MDGARERVSGSTAAGESGSGSVGDSRRPRHHYVPRDRGGEGRSSLWERLSEKADQWYGAKRAKEIADLRRVVDEAARMADSVDRVEAEADRALNEFRDSYASRGQKQFSEGEFEQAAQVVEGRNEALLEQLEALKKQLESQRRKLVSDFGRESVASATYEVEEGSGNNRFVSSRVDTSGLAENATSSQKAALENYERLQLAVYELEKAQRQFNRRADEFSRSKSPKAFERFFSAVRAHKKNMAWWATAQSEQLHDAQRLLEALEAQKRALYANNDAAGRFRKALQKVKLPWGGRDLDQWVQQINRNVRYIFRGITGEGDDTSRTMAQRFKDRMGGVLESIKQGFANLKEYGTRGTYRRFARENPEQTSGDSYSRIFVETVLKDPWRIFRNFFGPGAPAEHTAEATINADADTERAGHDLDEVAEDRTATINADADTLRAREKLARLARPRYALIVPKIDALAYTRVATALKALSGFRMSKEFVKSFTDFAKDIDQNIGKIAAVILTISTLTAGLGALTSQVATLTASVISMLPALYALPGITAAFAVAGWTAYNAFKKLGDRLDDVKEKYKKLNQEASDKFWDTAEKPLRDALDKIYDEWSKGLLANSKAMGNLFARAVTAASRELSGGQITKMFENINEGLRRMEDGVDALVEGLVRIIDIGLRFFPRFGDWFTEWTTKFNDWTKNSDKVEKAIEDGIEATKQFMRVLHHLGGILYAVYTAADKAGAVGLKGFADQLERIHNELDSMDSQFALMVFFQGANDAMRELSPAVKMIWGDFKTLTPLIAELMRISSRAIVAFVQLWSNVANNVQFQDGLKEMFLGIQQGMEALAPHGDALGRILGSLFKFIGLIAREAGPLLGTVLEKLAPIAEKLVEALKPLVHEMFKQFKEWIDKLAPVVEDFVEKLANWVKENPELAAKIGMAVLALILFVPAAKKGKDVLDDIADAASLALVPFRLLGGAIGKVGKGLKKLKKIWSGNADDVAEDAARGARGAGNTARAGAQGAEAAAGGAAARSGGVLSKVGNLAKGAGKAAGPIGILIMLGDVIAGALEGSDKLKESLDKIFSEGGALSQSWEVIKGIGTGVGELFGGVTDFFKEIGASLGDILGDILGAFGGDSGEGGVNTGLARAKILALAVAGAFSVIAAVLRLIGALLGWVITAIWAVVKGVAGLFEALYNFTTGNGWKSNLWDSIPKDFDKANKRVANAWNNIGTVWNKVVDDGTSKVAELNGLTVKNAENTKAAASQSAEAIANAFGSAGQRVQESNGLITTSNGEVVASATAAAGTIVDAYGNAIDGARVLNGQIVDANGEVIEGATLASGSVVENGEIIKGAFGDMGLSASDTFGNIKTDSQDSSDGVKNAFDVDISSTGSKLGDSIANGIAEAFKRMIRDLVPGWVNDLKDGITAFNLVESGKSLINGFFDGIKSVWDKGVNWVKKKLEVFGGLFPHSPAKWGPFSGKGYTTHSGKALMTDFGRGIVSAAPGVQNMLESSLEDVHSALDEVYTGTYIPGGTIDSKLNISGQMMNQPDMIHSAVASAFANSVVSLDPNTDRMIFKYANRGALRERRIYA